MVRFPSAADKTRDRVARNREQLTCIELALQNNATRGETKTQIKTNRITCQSHADGNRAPPGWKGSDSRALSIALGK